MGIPALFLIFIEEGNILSPDVTTLVVFVVVILLVGVLNAILFKPILSVLDEREHRTTGTLAVARAMMSDCDGKLARYEGALRDARAENYRMLEARRKQALEERAQAVARAKEEAQRMIDAARKEIAGEAEEAKKRLADESRLTARMIATAILRRPIAEASRHP